MNKNTVLEIYTILNIFSANLVLNIPYVNASSFRMNNYIIFSFAQFPNGGPLPKEVTVYPYNLISRKIARNISY